jgi:hypothetical protein
MALIAFYVVAIVILILHFTGWLAKNRLEWIVLVLAAATFPAVYFLSPRPRCCLPPTRRPRRERAPAAARPASAAPIRASQRA